jgi:hypothetical protein
MRRTLLAVPALLLASTALAAESCLEERAGLVRNHDYSVIAGWSKGDLRLLLEEYSYLHQWMRHSDAVSAGFLYGDEVYAEALSPTGVFDPRRVDAWKAVYAKTRRADYVKRLGSQLDAHMLDKNLVAAVLDSCLRNGWWAELKPLDDCRFTFTAGFRPQGRKELGTQPIKFHVSGGRCDPWPNRPIDATGISVPCVRSGNGSATVTLEIGDGSVLKKQLAAVPVRRVPDEPVLEKRPAPREIEVLTLYRSRDYRQIEFGRSCPSCRLLAADIRPTQPDATILDVAVVSTGGSGHWFRCPAVSRCGVPEFSPPDQRNVSGCAGQRACRVWRLSDDEAEAQDAIQITYQAEKATCRNCPEAMDYASARRRWEGAKIQAERVCEIFPDSPAQVFGRPATR